MKNNILYFIIGVLATLVIMLSISATTENNNGYGRYQVTGDNYTTIVDTKTGIAKYFGSNYVTIFDYSTGKRENIKHNK